ncbi:TOM1-like protein 2, partial [Pollicipes pollicipes]|uniref:TOM1-like protein 2 n=1 Tax=Pollicipes pollicipes TaxID=41117 RepID=UPI0018858ED0
MAGAMANLFAGNPMTTAVGHKIEEATDPSLASEDWSRNMEICDLVNASDEAARDAARAIKKRLHHFSGKNYAAVMYTLTVLETCVKNCGRNFHSLICQKDYIQDLIKLIGPRNEPPLAVQEKVLSMVQSWAHTFRGQPDLAGAAAVYDELVAKGVQFPDGGEA